ncbi:DUF4179 domain-containing protein [Bacillus sp. B15-48]|uniref:DUF4179 domain-containing protein n=1 Tax=Bacillus sp. B15-48 TaxID=1548601 RepID=UPI00193FE329|nr:DUF4179 domain-containing protein [Bacillus sp. B15-48]
MSCPNEDKWLDYVDGFLDEEETRQIQKHILSCSNCAQQLEVLISEKAFLEETLKSPVLPDNFAEAIVAKVTPYKSKMKRRWKWGLGTAASVLLAGGIIMTVHPSFAELVGGIFSSEQVDEGLQIAMDTDIATPIDLAVTDAGITLHVEHLIADTSRIALSYYVSDSKGKKLNPYFEGDGEQQIVTLLDENNEQVELANWSWGNTDNYGIFEFSLVNVEQFTKGTIRISSTEIAGKTGNWLVEIPVDLTAAYEKQQIVEIREAIEVEDIEVTFNQVSYSTSTTDLSYSTEYTEEAKQKLQAAIEEKEQQFNQEIVNTFFRYHPTIGYRIENSQGDILGYYNIYGKVDRGHPVNLNMIGGIGSWDGKQEEMRQMTWNDSFVPDQGGEELYFVLDTVYKTNTTDFSVTFKPDQLPYTFEYNGYELTIDDVERKTDYSLKKSWIPIQRQVTVELHMSGYAEQKAPELAVWTIDDESGESYFTFNSGSTTLDETDAQGRFKREVRLISYELQEIPKEITLHLIAETEAIELENEWRVPLF